jgi:hypothetical protein
MRLVSRSGSSVELHIAGYQFPDARPHGDEDWDANWLIISGQVDAGRRLRWEFRDPSLTTWEASELIAWMRQVSAGEVAPAGDDQKAPTEERLGQAEGQAEAPDHWSRLTDAGWLTFVEPNLAFAVAPYVADRVHLRVGLGAESGPPPVDRTTPDWHEITLNISRDEVLAAGAALERELLAFPAR